jgi:D-cysteine desulfhydrase
MFQVWFWQTEVEDDPGLTGNLLVERMVGAHVSLVSKEEYVKYGSVMLGNLLADKLKSQGRKPYVIPVGGSDSLGTWGYIEFVRELKTQLQEGRTSGVTHFDDIVMACGRFMLHYSLCSLLFLYAG